MATSLKAGSVDPGGELCQSVQQRHMGCGDIELF